MSYDTLNDKLYDECGVFAIYGSEGVDPAECICYGLHALQHRGQASCGIAVSDGNGIVYSKGTGLVTERFNNDVLARLKGAKIGVGHVRHSTNPFSSSVNAQPQVVDCHNFKIALVFNGSVVNRDDLRKELQQSGSIFQTNTDAEVMVNMISRTCMREDIPAAIKSTMAYVKGSYAFIIMTDKEIYAVRDPYGNKPLALGQLNGNWVLASETCAFDTIGAEFVRDVEPGELIRIDASGLTSEIITNVNKKLCVFEFVYFARPDSTIDGVSVYESRFEFGRQLSHVLPVEADLVIGVPDSALAAAAGYAEESGIEYGDGLCKNRYTGRTISGSAQLTREQSVRLKLNTIRENVKGKRIILVDDSILRGTTSKYIVEMLREAGATEVHLRVASPAYKYQCAYGIHSPRSSELIGAEYSIENINKIIGTDTLAFLPLDMMLGSISENNSGFCTCCFDGDKIF